jgi:hypothetical protein
MHDVSIYLAAQWDFVGAPNNDVNEIWILSDSNSYPTLSAFSGIKPVTLAGNGTWISPYVISTASELAAITYHSYYHGYSYYTLTADIDLSGTKWRAPVLWHFTGSLDGRGHAIRGFSQERSCGFLDRIENGAMVANLHLEQCEITAQEGTVGCLAGESRGLILNCSVTGTVTGGTVTGGLVGLNAGSIWDSSFSGVTAGTQKSGGLVGENAAVMTNAMSGGTVSGGCQVGGLVGNNASTASIRSCCSTAAVTGQAQVGGLLGTNGGSARDCYARGTVAGDHDVGGLVGQNSAHVSSCYSTGAVTGSYGAGGLFGGITAAPEVPWDNFWDTDSSGIPGGAGSTGTGVNRQQMQDINTFLKAGWDLVGETENGLEDIWMMPENGYPELTMSLTYQRPVRATRS